MARIYSSTVQHTNKLTNRLIFRGTAFVAQPVRSQNGGRNEQFADPPERTGFPIIGLKPQPREVLEGRTMISQLTDGLALDRGPQTRTERRIRRRTEARAIYLMKGNDPLKSISIFSTTSIGWPKCCSRM